MRPAGGFVLFKDRHDAGKRLAQRLLRYKGAKDTIIVSLPRGGVVVGYDISLTLGVPWMC